MNVYLVSTYDNVLAVFSTFDDANDFLAKHDSVSGNIWIESMIVDAELNT